MKIIIPMAGMGKRMRPHTLTTPKPLINVGGKSIVQRLVEGISNVLSEPIEEIGFIIGDFGKEVESKLLSIAEKIGAKGKIYYQKEALGTAHAILCAAESLKGKVIVAYADTLFKADFSLDVSKDGIIWTHKVENPSDFGVVKVDENGNISDFFEKPKEFVSDLAIIGIYYFKDGEYLKSELQFLINNNTKTNGEYGITDALYNMMKKGTKFSTSKVEEWLDCGNKNATVYTNQRILELEVNKELIADSSIIINSTVIKPCFIGEDVKIENSVVGPHVSVGKNSIINKSILCNSIIQNNSIIKNMNIENSMVGNFAKLNGKSSKLSLGDYSEI